MTAKTILLAAGFAAVSTAAIAEPNTFAGVTLTSNYVTGGYTASDDKAALQAYIERVLPGGFYLGVWGSSMDWGGDHLEVDLYGGYRGAIGKLNYDLTYYRYIYDNSGDCCEEVWISASYPVAEPLTIGFLYRDDLENLVRYRPFFAYDFGGGYGLSGLLQKADGQNGIYGKLEVSKKLDDGMSIGVAYHDRSDADKIIELKISFNTAFGG